MIRRARMLSVLGFLLAGGLGIISSTQTWLTAHRSDAGEALLVTGADAVALLAPLSLAVLALGAALSIAGIVLRYVFAVLGLGAAVILLIQTVPVLTDPPLSAVAATVTEATGLSGDRALEDIVAGLETSPWPFIAAFAWVLLAAASVLLGATARRWTTGGRRYRSAKEAVHHDQGPLDAVDSWDELSHGTDPTT